MGPSQAGSSAWRTAPRVSAAPVAPRAPADSAALGANLTKTAAPTLKKERTAERHAHADDDGDDGDDDDVEVYSDPDEGVEIVDMKNVHTMDWMAPESLKWESRDRTKRKAKAARVKKEEEPTPSKEKGVHFFLAIRLSGRVDSILRQAKQELMETVGSPVVGDAADINLANALDLSESEEEENMEDIIDDFSQSREVNLCVAANLLRRVNFLHGQDHQGLRQERLYFFQFPSPFPTFVSSSSTQSDPGGNRSVSESQGKRVSFSEDTKPPAPVPEDVDEEKPLTHVDGVIGQLEIYQSGAVKMRLANGILMDVGTSSV
jgi:DNA-directed RNA polymerase III subunit RPC4